MNLKLKLLVACLFIFLSSQAQQAKTSPIEKANNNPNTKVGRPKLVIGMVVDQMRWDYLYRYYERYGTGGFKRILNEGFSAENTLIPYTPSQTACGHATIYTGTVPAIHGIIANSWFDPQLGKDVYCVEDKSVQTVGSTSSKGLMSTKNLLVTTLADELKMATNFKSKVISVSLKDRGSILPGGHTANGSYWYDDQTGNFISSTFYMKELPTWVQSFNSQKWPNQYFSKNWTPLYPLSTYTQSTADDKPYERPFANIKTSSFPHNFSSFVDKNFGMITSMPYGNTMTLDFAKAAIPAEKLGMGTETDFLAVSLSSTDYIGHQFGPNSIEVEDTYLRLDKDLADFFTYLDKTIGKGNYLFFLSADHGATHAPGFSTENRMPGGGLQFRNYRTELEELILKDFNLKGTISSVSNNQIILNHAVLNEAKIDATTFKKYIINYILKQPGILNAVDIQNLQAATMPAELKERIAKGYHPRRSGDIYIILDAGWYPSTSPGTGHGAWNPYDTHIPALFMGWGIKPGKTNKKYYMSDIAPTVSALLRIQEPSGSIGNVILEALK
ncbi:MAG: alkaline phosphatase family protein [Pedobacter sp.]|nr:MAG: alkaline phosphatase family protein [Pedobacter sp.]